MRFYEVIIHDMWMHGKSIEMIVDTNIEVNVNFRVGDKIITKLRKITGVVLEYKGKHDLYSLKREIPLGKKIVIGISRDFQYCTTLQEFEFCA